MNVSRFLTIDEAKSFAEIGFSDKLILASQSPRRRELISLITKDFEVIVSSAEESLEGVTDAFSAPEILAEQKASAVSAEHIGRIVIGCDTVVIADGQILGKPKDEAQAVSMLKMLSDKTHYVVSGVCITDGTLSRSFSDTTAVTFRKLSDDEITQYVGTGEPMDKAGSYGIQGAAGEFVREISGSYYNVVGFPVNKIREELKRFCAERKI